MGVSRSARGSVPPIAAAGAVGAALASSLCCLVPFLLVSAGIAGPWLAGLRAFDPVRVPLEAVSVCALAAAWIVHLRRVRTCDDQTGCALPARVRSIRLVLALATATVIALVAAPYVIARLGA